MRPGRPKPPFRAVVRKWWSAATGVPAPREIAPDAPVEPLKTGRPRSKGFGQGNGWRLACSVVVAAGQLLGWSCPATGFAEMPATLARSKHALSSASECLAKRQRRPSTGHPAVFGPSGMPPADQSFPRLLRASRCLQGASVAYRVTHPAAYGLQVAREPCSRASNT